MRWCDDWLLLPQRIALHEPSATAVIADVHLGYSAARQRQGDALPFRAVADELAPLINAMALHRMTRLIVAGDLFERGYDAAISTDLLEVLTQGNVELIAVVPGNHDRGIEKSAHDLPIFAAGFDLAGWHIIHGDQPTTSPRTVMGHWHPALRVGRLKLPCFLARQTHLILPAFSLDAAGVDARRCRWRGWNCMAVRDGMVAEKMADAAI